jgi:heme A synthase
MDGDLAYVYLLTALLAWSYRLWKRGEITERRHTTIASLAMIGSALNFYLDPAANASSHLTAVAILLYTSALSVRSLFPTTT